MARSNRLRERLAAGRTSIGPIFQEFWSPELFEFCALAGFDFVVADGEHAGVDPAAVRGLARAAQGAGARRHRAAEGDVGRGNRRRGHRHDQVGDGVDAQDQLLAGAQPGGE